MIKRILVTALGFKHLMDVYFLIAFRYFFKSKKIGTRNETLVVHLSVALGDEIWMMGFVKQLQALKPGEPITLIVSPKFKTFIEANTTDVSVISYPFVSDKSVRLIFRLYSVLKFARSLGKQFKTTITPRVQDDQYAAFICYALSGGMRFGFDQYSTPSRSKYCPGVNKLLTHAVKPISMEHHTLENVQEILKAIDPNAKLLASPWLCKEDENSKRQSPSARTIVLSISSGHSLLKKWPVSSFSALVTSLNAQVSFPVHFIVIGDSADISDSLEIMKRVGATVSIESRVAKQTLQEVLSLLRQADIYIGADTGLLHMANAAGVACIGIFGSSCTHQFSPYLKANSVVVTNNMPCSPCNTGHLIDRCSKCIFDEPKCMTNLSPSTVVNATLNLLHMRQSAPNQILQMHG
jgi:ADP-heptose:LPS heptosyltransferase